MASKKRKVYFSALQVRWMLTHELQEDRAAIKSEIFDPIVEKYNTSKENGDFSDFQKKVEESQEVFMVSMLHYENNVLCGIVSHGTPKIERYLRECNPETFSVKELVPSEGNVFEEYSFFAISIQKMQMAYLSDSAVSTNIPALVLLLLRPVVNINYELEESCLLDTDIKKKIKQLGDKVVVKGTLVGKEEQVIGGLESIGTLERAMGTKFRATINVKAKLGRKLTDADIEAITGAATQDEGFSSFTFADEKDADQEVIDVIKNQVRFSKKIELTAEERKIPSAIWKKLCGAFLVGDA